MDRFKGMMRDTWWLWLALCGGGCVMGLLLDKIFFISIPISIFAFFYFGYMRYDDEGNQLGE